MAIEIKIKDRSRGNLKLAKSRLSSVDSVILEEGQSISYDDFISILRIAVGTGGGDGSYHIDGGTWDSTYLIDQNLNGGGW